MFLDSWSIALLICGFVVLFLYIGYIALMDRYVLYNLKRGYSVVFGESKLKLANRYLINSDGMSEILSKSIYYSNDVEIDILKKDSEIQGLMIKRQKIIKNSLDVLGGLILIIAILIWIRLRYTKKIKNKMDV